MIATRARPTLEYTPLERSFTTARLKIAKFSVSKRSVTSRSSPGAMNSRTSKPPRLLSISLTSFVTWTVACIMLAMAAWVSDTVAGRVVVINHRLTWSGFIHDRTSSFIRKRRTSRDVPVPGSRAGGGGMLVTITSCSSRSSCSSISAGSAGSVGSAGSAASPGSPCARRSATSRCSWRLLPRISRTSRRSSSTPAGRSPPPSSGRDDAPRRRPPRVLLGCAPRPLDARDRWGVDRDTDREVERELARPRLEVARPRPGAEVCCRVVTI